MSSAAIIGSIISFASLALFFSISKKFTFKTIDTTSINVPYLNNEDAIYYNSVYDIEKKKEVRNKYQVYLENLIDKFNLKFIIEHFDDRISILGSYLTTLKSTNKKIILENEKFIVNQIEEIYSNNNYNDTEILKMLKHLKFEITNPVFIDTFYTGLNEKKIKFELLSAIEKLDLNIRNRKNLKNRVFYDIN